MPRTPRIHLCGKSSGRAYYRIRVNNKVHHSGTDPAETYRRAAELLGGLPSEDAPVMLSELRPVPAATRYSAQTSSNAVR